MMDFQTPKWVCNYMVSLIPTYVMEVLEPTPGEGNLVGVLQGCGYKVITPIDFWELQPRQYECIVMNPPFSPMKVGYEILEECMTMSYHIIALMPWLTIINSEKRTSDIFDWGLKSVTHLPRKVFHGARVQCCILEMHNQYHGVTSFRNLPWVKE